MGVESRPERSTRRCRFHNDRPRLPWPEARFARRYEGLGSLASAGGRHCGLDTPSVAGHGRSRRGEACLSSVSLVLGWPSPAGANGNAGSVESVGDGLWVDAVSGGDGREREPGGVQVGRGSESFAGPFTLRSMSFDVVAVESCRDGGSMEPVPVGEFVDRCA